MNVLLAVLIAVTPCTPGRGGTGHQTRHRAVRAQYQRTHPCPATRRTTGPCHGWVVDHHVALVCCGTDTTNNMVWQTVTDGKTKDRTEQNCATR